MFKDKIVIIKYKYIDTLSLLFLEIPFFLFLYYWTNLYIGSIVGILIFILHFYQWKKASNESLQIKISFIVFSDEVKGLTLKGFKYNVENLNIKKGETRCISNIIIEKESDRLGNMVTELLDFSEISSGRLIMNKELFDLNELGIFINKQLMPKSSSKKIDMILNYDETKRVMVMADRDRIKQVFINILDNALKFTDEGGVVLTDIKIEEDKAIIEVIDNGCGISEDEISLVTGKFYKGTNSNSHTGLGLSICEEIVKAHNGNLIIRSVLEKGTVVRVELPLEKGDIQNEA